jgi:hypothetical protein
MKFYKSGSSYTDVKMVFETSNAATTVSPLYTLVILHSAYLLAVDPRIFYLLRGLAHVVR